MLRNFQILNSYVFLNCLFTYFSLFFSIFKLMEGCYTSWIPVLAQIYILQIFSPMLWLHIHFFIMLLKIITFNEF